MGFGWEDIYNPFQQVKDLANQGSKAYTGSGGQGGNTYRLTRGPNGTPQYVPTNYGQALSRQTGLDAPVNVDDAGRQALLAQQGGLAGQFADQTQQSYGAYGTQGNQALAGLQAIAQGQNSVSAEQLRQGIGQLQSQQQSQAAGASPRNSAMAARVAANQSARLGYGMAGQQALAGLQERQQATQAYGNLLGTLRGQDLNAALSSRQNAESGYGAGMTGNPQKTWIEQYGPAIAGGIGAAASDRTVKTGIKNGDGDANKAIEGLRAYSFKYKDPSLGGGKQVGVMSDDLKRVGLGHTVVPTKGGDVVLGGKLSTANTAMIAALGDRVRKLEGKR